mgnify:CR=1 FL=1
MTSSLIINISCLIIQERKVFKFENRNDIFLQSCSLCCQALNIFWLLQDQVDYHFICFLFSRVVNQSRASPGTHHTHLHSLIYRCAHLLSQLSMKINADVCPLMLRSVQMFRSMFGSVLTSVHTCSDQCG